VGGQVRPIMDNEGTSGPCQCPEVGDKLISSQEGSVWGMQASCLILGKAAVSR